jgi:hypothetical protein
MYYYTDPIFAHYINQPLFGYTKLVGILIDWFCDEEIFNLWFCHYFGSDTKEWVKSWNCKDATIEATVGNKANLKKRKTYNVSQKTIIGQINAIKQQKFCGNLFLDFFRGIENAKPHHVQINHCYQVDNSIIRDLVLCFFIDKTNKSILNKNERKKIPLAKQLKQDTGKIMSMYFNQWKTKEMETNTWQNEKPIPIFENFINRRNMVLCDLDFVFQ